MAEENKFGSTVDSLFKGMNNFISSKTVVGDAVTVNDTIILPLVDVSFGVGAGAFLDGNKNKSAGGLGGKMTASAVLVIKDNQIRLVNVKNQDTVTKILDMVPDLVERFQKKDENAEESSEEVDTAVADILEDK